MWGGLRGRSAPHGSSPHHSQAALLVDRRRSFCTSAVRCGGALQLDAWNANVDVTKVGVVSIIFKYLLFHPPATADTTVSFERAAES